MESENIIFKLKKSNLSGRSGSGFPTWLKWEMVKRAKDDKKYIICNASEGELRVFKDSYILKKYPKEVIEGIKTALDFFENSQAYIYLRKDYYQKFGSKLKKFIGQAPIKLVEKVGSYIAGEETALCEVIEGRRAEPRLKPPFPTGQGLFGFPTLVNNVETFYYINKISNNSYEGKRFYSIEGDVKNKGVFELPENWSLEKILKETKNYPVFDFFTKVGGGACGEIFLKEELKNSLCGAGSIIIFKKDKANYYKLMKEWINFFHQGNCDKCVPCREGVFRLKELIEKKKIDKELIEDLFFVLENTSFCALGKSVPVSFRGVLTKLLK